MMIEKQRQQLGCDFEFRNAGALGGSAAAMQQDPDRFEELKAAIREENLVDFSGVRRVRSWCAMSASRCFTPEEFPDSLRVGGEHAAHPHGTS